MACEPMVWTAEMLNADELWNQLRSSPSTAVVAKPEKQQPSKTVNKAPTSPDAMELTDAVFSKEDCVYAEHRMICAQSDRAMAGCCAGTPQSVHVVPALPSAAQPKQQKQTSRQKRRSLMVPTFAKFKTAAKLKSKLSAFLKRHQDTRQKPSQLVFVLYGSAGVGKHTLVQSALQALDFDEVQVLGSDKRASETVLRAMASRSLFQVADRTMRCVVLREGDSLDAQQQQSLLRQMAHLFRGKKRSVTCSPLVVLANSYDGTRVLRTSPLAASAQMYPMRFFDVVDTARTMSLATRRSLSKPARETLARQSQGDLRRLRRMILEWTSPSAVNRRLAVQASMQCLALDGTQQVAAHDFMKRLLFPLLRGRERATNPVFRPSVAVPRSPRHTIALPFRSREEATKAWNNNMAAATTKKKKTPKPNPKRKDVLRIEEVVALSQRCDYSQKSALLFTNYTKPLAGRASKFANTPDQHQADLMALTLAADAAELFSGHNAVMHHGPSSYEDAMVMWGVASLVAEPLGVKFAGMAHAKLSEPLRKVTFPERPKHHQDAAKQEELRLAVAYDASRSHVALTRQETFDRVMYCPPEPAQDKSKKAEEKTGGVLWRYRKFRMEPNDVVAL